MKSNDNLNSISGVLPGVLFILLLALAFLIFTQFQNNDSNWFSTILISYGNFLSGLGAIGLIIVAYIQIPIETERYRQQISEQASLERQRLDKQAELDRAARLNERKELVAAESIESIHRISNAILHITNPFSYVGEGNTEDLEKQSDSLSGFEKAKLQSEIFSKVYLSRFELVKEDINFFFKTLTKSKIFLPVEACTILEEVATCYKAIRVDAIMHSKGLAAYKLQRPIKVYDEAYDNFYDTNKTRQKFIDQKRTELEEILKPFIHPV